MTFRLYYHPFSPVIFFGGKVYVDGDLHHADVTVQHGRIIHVGRARSFDRALAVDARGCIVCPGWVNAHDHLDLALYPKVAPNAPYMDGHTWGMDVLAHLANDSALARLRAVPTDNAIAWGVLRNLLHGATTVQHHNAAPGIGTQLRMPIRLHLTPFWVHSIRQSTRFAWISAAAKRLRQPVILHAAEANRGTATQEITWLAQKRYLHDQTILIHAVAATEDDLDNIQQTNAALVSCVSSNRFVLGKTADLRAWNRRGIRAGLGTDSPLTADGGMLDEIRAAHTYGGLSPREALSWATLGGARVLRINTGQLRQGCLADLVVYRTRAERLEHLLELQPDQVELVCVQGKAALAIPSRADDMWKTGRVPREVVVSGEVVLVDHLFAECLIKLPPWAQATQSRNLLEPNSGVVLNGE